MTTKMSSTITDNRLVNLSISVSALACHFGFKSKCLYSFLTFISPHLILTHFISSHFISLHCIALRCISSHLNLNQPDLIRNDLITSQLTSFRLIRLPVYSLYTSISNDDFNSLIGFRLGLTRDASWVRTLWRQARRSVHLTLIRGACVRMRGMSLGP